MRKAERFRARYTERNMMVQETGSKHTARKLLACSRRSGIPRHVDAPKRFALQEMTG